MNLTYIKEDNLVVVDGHAIFGNYDLPTGFEGTLKAIQWEDTSGSYETEIGTMYTNMDLDEASFKSIVEPLYNQWLDYKQQEDISTIEELPVATFEEVKADKLEKANALYTMLSNQYITINDISLKKDFDVVTEWLTFAKFKEDSNLTIPTEAVLLDTLGNNMNALSVPMIMGTMWQLTQAIMTLRAEHSSLIARINACTTIPELEAIVTTLPV